MTATLEHQQSKIDGYLATFDGVTVFDHHHRALIGHVRHARETMTRAHDLQGPKEVAEQLHKAYELPANHLWAIRARDYLDDLPNRPFEGVVDLETPAGSFFSSSFRM